MSSDSTAEAKKAKKKKQRSPNYPAIGLGQALELAEKQYKVDGTQKIPVKIAHERWGYKPGGSPGDLMLAALKAYGLTEVEGSGEKRQVALTELARKIFLDHPDRAKIIQEAALTPKIHREIWDHYGGDIPRDDVLRHYLIWELKFNDKSVEGFISQFRGTISFANLEKDYILESERQEKSTGEENGEREKGEQQSGKPQTKRLQRMDQLSQQSEFRELKFLLPSGEAVLFVPSSMKAPDFTILATYLDAFRSATEQAVEPEDAGSANSED